MRLKLQYLNCEAREVQLQQRVWHVEALAEEAAAREVAGRQAEACKPSKLQMMRFRKDTYTHTRTVCTILYIYIAREKGEERYAKGKVRILNLLL